MSEAVAIALIEALPIPAFLVAPSARVTGINPAARAHLGEAMLGRHYVTALRQPGILDAIERSVETGRPAEAPYTTSLGGTEARKRGRAAPRGAAADGAVLVTLEDVTPLHAAGLMRRDFVANVSHELRTPLTALIGFIETLKGPAAKDPAASTRFLDLMQKEALRMNRLVGDLLSLSRVESNERQRPSDAVPLLPVLRASISSLAALAKQAQVTVELVAEPGEILVPGDEDQLRQVVNNLLENALKYGASGGIVWLRVLPPAHDPILRGRAVRLLVEDRGGGIDPIHLPRLTERFYRVDEHRSREMGGTGLGLAIVKHIVNRHRGRMEIDSEIGKGTTFTVYLPVL
jgi:two-component system phosphate regulon sensor histidine kinase PhoR